MMNGMAALVGSADPRTPMNKSFAIWLTPLNVAAQRSQRQLPLLVVCSLARAKGDAECAELRGATRLLRTGVDVRARSDFEVDESGRCDGECNLSFQESTG